VLASSMEIAHPTQAAFYGGAFSIGVWGQNDGLENIPNGGEDNDMFLKQRREGHLVEVAEIQELINPSERVSKAGFIMGKKCRSLRFSRRKTWCFPLENSCPDAGQCHPHITIR